MSDLKVYTHVDRQNRSSQFGVSRMEEIHDHRGGTPDVAHRHNFYTVLLTVSASGRHIIDFNEYPLFGRQVFFISPGQVHQVIEKERPLGYSIVFTPDFLATNNIPVSFIENLNLFLDYGEAPPLEPTEAQFAHLMELTERMLKYQTEKPPFSDRALAALLELFLIASTNMCTREDHPQLEEAAHALLRSFKQLVEQHHTEHHDTAYYAGQLHITPDHLNRSVKGLIHRTAKEYIQSRLTIAAKRMLLFSELSVKEIGFQLGFSEASNFSAFFKNCTGMTPGAFRNHAD